MIRTRPAHTRRLPQTTVVAPLVAALLLFVSSQRSVGQVVIPPSASLDVQIPAAPTPIRIGGRMHLVYELHITNFRAVDLVLTRVEVLSGDRNHAQLASYEDKEFDSKLARAGTRRDVSDKRTIKPGMRDIFFVWLALDEAARVPAVLHHRISFRVMNPGGEEAGIVEGAQVNVRQDAPVVLSPPLRGGPWVAVYDPSSIAGHRRVLFAINGKARIPARFAIDWVKLGSDGLFSLGDASIMSNYYGYGAEVLAVADAIVVDVRDGLPEPTSAISLDIEGGNYVVLDLGASRFAFYEHLKPGSIRVKTGDRVQIGSVLALLGGSGSVSSGPHLHFHVSDANSLLGAEGIPYVFRSFERLGAFESLESLGSGRPWRPQPREKVTTRTMEMPLNQTVLRF